MCSAAIGAHGGSYSIYHALALAINELKSDHKPDFTNTEPAATIGPFPSWSDPKKIVAMDPYGHLAPWLYKDYIDKEGVEIRPTIAVTKAHMRLPELEQCVRDGKLEVDGKIVINEFGELAVTKFAVEPVWYLPGVAERFGIGTFENIIAHTKEEKKCVRGACMLPILFDMLAYAIARQLAISIRQRFPS